MLYNFLKIVLCYWNLFLENIKINQNVTFLHDFFKYFNKKYLYTINHKRIAINYFIFCLISGLAGTVLATLIRLELAVPGSFLFKYDSIRYLQVITAHGLTMIFFVVVPLVFGAFANFLIPYHIGSKDVAFPRLNSLGFWLLPSGYVLLAKPAFIRSSFAKQYDIQTYFFKLLKWDDYSSIKKITTNNINFGQNFNNQNLTINNFFLEKNINFSTKIFFFNNLIKSSDSLWRFILNGLNVREKKKYQSKCSNALLTMSGWTFITPFSSKTKYTGVGAQDIAIISVILSGISTTISFTNLLITRRTLSAPGLRNRRVLIPFLSITLFLVMRMLALITPVLGAAMIMLLLDRHWKTSFFDYVYGGDIVLFNHLFWFFGHPEVYVVIIPAFGIVNMLLPYYNTRRIASKHHLIWATYIMGYMGFLVWGHHMYLVGLDHRSRSLYSTVTVMISLPAIVKLVNWTLTILNGTLKIDTAILFINVFFFFFLCGGLTGMWLSHVGLNVYVHDTFYVVAHFHFMFSSSTFSAIFAAIYYYYSVLFGIKFSKIFSILHLIYWFCGQWLTFLPLFWIGYNGLPRRYHDYPIFYMGWHGLSTIGHFLVIVSLIFFFLGILDSLIEKKIYTHNTLGIPRFNKRINYYLFKIRYNQYIFNITQNILNFSQTKIVPQNVNFVKYKNNIKLLNMFVLINIIINILILINLTLIAGILPLLERKYLSLIQRRVGPTFVGYRGRLQFIADALKMFLKSSLIPSKFNTQNFLFFPALTLSIIYLFWLNAYWGVNIIYFDFEYNIVFLIIISGFLNFFIILTAIFSGNVYSTLAGVRTIVLTFCLELLLSLLFLNLQLFNNSFNFSYSFINQQEFPLITIFFWIYSSLIILMLIEINRAPFDLVEAESELISGYHVELGGFFFGLFYLGEYFHLFFTSVFIVILFLN